jgi:hypothetical protein
MANYLITSCDELTTVVVNSGENEIIPGNTYYISFTGETNPGCFTAGLESEEALEDGISSVTGYTDCLECLLSEGFSATLASCNDEFIYPQTLNEFPNLPIVGEYYRFCDPSGDGLCFCFEFLGFTSEPGIPALYNGGPFTDCNCQEPPRSANTETFICQEICFSGGTTTTFITPPHPVWTDGYGTQVTQLNMITLGGINGLNN